MKKFMSVAMAIALACGTMLGLASCTGSSNDSTSNESGSDKTKTPIAGLICLHGSNSTYDKNFIDAFEAACAEKGLTKEEYLIVTDIPEDQTCKEKALEFADDGCKVVFADSFGHEPWLMEAAEEATDVQFCHATGVSAHLDSSPANYHNAFASIYEGRYLAGVAAGMKLQAMIDAGEITESQKTKDGNWKIGYVGAWTYAEVVSGYTSFYLGVKSIVPNVVMDVKFTGSWYDETAEKATANELINGGCVLISQHADSMGAPTACEEKGVPNVSYNGSTATACPDTFIISSRIDWQPYFEYMLDCVMNNKTIDKDWCGTFENGAVALTDLGSAAAPGTAAKLEEVKEQLANGSLHVFDTSKFTVTVTESLNANATVDGEGHLTAYMADTDGDYKGDANVVANGYFAESDVKNHRSAPYFDLTIDGITLLNTKF